MKTRHTKHRLPREWGVHAETYGLLGELDIKIRPRSRLYLKVLMFRNNAGMRRFWKEQLHRSELCRHTMGCVSGLSTVNELIKKNGDVVKRYKTVDGRYFAIMALIAGRVNLEIIAHESVHAGFAYAKRVNHKDLWHHSNENEEENVCYPTGRIATTIFDWCYRRGYFGKGKRR